MFATLTFLPHTRFTPTQNISSEPTSDRYDIAVSVIIGATSRASSVMPPSNTNTGITENMQPRPIAEVMTAMMMKSITAFTARVE